MPELYIDCEDEAFDAAPLSAHGLEGTESDVALAAELVFTDEEGIRALNARTRGKDAVTDVLSYPNFDLGGGAIRGEDYPYDRDEDGRLFLGSIVICRGPAASCIILPCTGCATFWGSIMKRKKRGGKCARGRS